MTPLPTTLLVHPVLPSILGPDVAEVPIAPISLPQHSDIRNVHVFPTHLDLDRLQNALAEMTRLYPVLCARVRRREAARADGRPYDYYVRSPPGRARTSGPALLTNVLTDCSLS